MNTIGDGKPAGIQSYSHAAVKQSNYENRNHAQNPEPEHCEHEPDGWGFDEHNHAFLVTDCEHCGTPLLATEINTELMQETGEISITEWRED